MTLTPIHEVEDAQLGNMSYIERTMAGNRNYGSVPPGLGEPFL